MKKVRFILSAILLGVGLSAFAQGTKCLPSRTDGVEPFQAGEKVVFNISYNWHAVQTDVAKGTLSVGQETLNGEKVWHTSLSMQTAPFFDVFFKILRDSREGDYHAINEYVYDRPAGVIHANLEYRDKDKITKDIPYGECTYDVTTLFYFARRMNFENMKAGTVQKISIAIDEDVLQVNLTYRGKENKFVRGIGTIAAHKVGIAVNKGEVFDGNEDALVWFSDDDNRIPIAFMAPLKVGAMNGRLASYEGLAHDFTALLSTKRIK